MPEIFINISFLFLSMLKKFSEIKVNDTVLVDGVKISVTEFEMSNIGKHGSVKCRIVGLNEKNERVVIIKESEDTVEVL